MFIFTYYISNDGSFSFYPRPIPIARNKSRSCTTCIVYVNYSKIASSIIFPSFQKADAKVTTLLFKIQINRKVFSKFSFSRRLSKRKGDKRKIQLSPHRLQIRMSNYRCFRFESGCKGKNFIA